MSASLATESRLQCSAPGERAGLVPDGGGESGCLCKRTRMCGNYVRRDRRGTDLVDVGKFARFEATDAGSRAVRGCR